MVHTLVLVGLVMLAAFCLAASTLSHLQLSTRYLDRTRGDNASRAAVTEFCLRARQFQASDVTQVPDPVLRHFAGQETLLAPSQHLDASATLLLARCRDNSANSLAVAGYYDAPGHNSVPPFGFSLVYEVKVGHSRFVYETMLQQRWPYVLAAPGPIVVAGRLGPAPGQSVADYEANQGALVRNAPLWQAPSVVEGRVLAARTSFYEGLAPGVLALEGETFYLALYPFASARGIYNRSTLQYSLHETGSPYRKFERMSLGGPIYLPQARLHHPSDSGDDGPAAPAYWAHTNYTERHSPGAIVKGQVDLMENTGATIVPGSEPPLTLPSPGVVVGGGCTLEGSVRNEVPARDLSGLFAPPSTSGWPMVDPQTSYADGKGRMRNPHERPRDGDLTLTNFSLAVAGDLKMDGGKLKGSNATLVVDGDLLITDGEMDAGGNGLVIFCRRLVLKAQGHFRGLLIAQQGAAIYSDNALRPEEGDPTVELRPPEAPQLEIRGGLLVGAHRVSVKPGFQGDWQGDTILHPAEVRCVMLVGTRLIYDPQYMRGLNSHGEFRALASQLRE